MSKAYTETDGMLVSLNGDRPQYAFHDAQGSLRALCRWNDPNGEWDNVSDSDESLTTEDLLTIVNQWCAEDAPHTQIQFDRWLSRNARKEMP